MNSQTQLETRPFNFPNPFNNLIRFVAGVGGHVAALGGCEDIRAKGRHDRSPYCVSGAAEFGRNPDGAIHGGSEGCH